MTSSLEGLVRAAARRPRGVLAVAAVVALAGAALALRLEPSAATSTLAGKRSATFQATERYRERFGDHAIVVLVHGDLAQLVLTENLGRLLRLEGCLSGNRPRGVAVAGGPRSPCAELALTRPVRTVYGPGTFVNAAVGEIQDRLRARLRTKAAQAARAADAARRLARGRGLSEARQQRAARSAEQLVYAETVRDLLALNLRYGLGLNAEPRIDDPDFVSALVFDPARGATTPKARFASLFPSRRAAAIQVRLKPGLSDAQRNRAVALVRGAVALPSFRLRNAGPYTVTGSPVVAEDLADALVGSTLRLLVVALVVMAGVLTLVFRRPLRLVPLAVALGAVAIAFGLTALAGRPLTMASIAAVPVLLGLGVDYAIQWQARAGEESPLRAARRVAPTLATAALATAVGFLVLLLSPVPMVRDFGALLVVGVGLGLVLALTAGTAALVVAGRARREGPLARSARGAGELFGAASQPLGRALAPAGRLAADASRSTVRAALGHPGRFLAVGLVLAAAGWVADSRATVVADLDRLVPQDLRAVRDLHTLQSTTGVAGEIDVIVEGRDLTQPAVVRWMRDYQAALVKRFGYRASNGCGRAELCPALSLPDLFRSAQSARSRREIRALLDAVGPYFSQVVITRDRRTASLAFGIRLESLDRQREVIDTMRARLRPPHGVRATLAGLPVLAAEANAQLSSPARRLGTLAAGLVAVALVLAAVYRRWERAWVPLVPVALATGWSALVLWLLGVPLNPMSATLGALVLALSTEFAVLLVARYRQERSGGLTPAEALARCYRSTGATVLASGATAIAGFAVLASSDVRMLQDFGIVTVVDLGVSLLGVLAVLPAALMVAERRAARERGAESARVAVPA